MAGGSVLAELKSCGILTDDGYRPGALLVRAIRLAAVAADVESNRTAADGNLIMVWLLTSFRM